MSSRLVPKSVTLNDLDLVHRLLNRRSGSAALVLDHAAGYHKDITRNTRAIFTNFVVHVAHVRGWILLRYVDNRPHRLSVGRGSRECTQRGRSVIYDCLVVFCESSCDNSVNKTKVSCSFAPPPLQQIPATPQFAMTAYITDFYII